jgi:hypothetical protein
MMVSPNELDWFWTLIEESSCSRVKLRSLLLDLDEAHLYKFQDIFVELASELKTEPFLNNMPESEDAIDDIADWVVSQGSAVYGAIIARPDSVPESVSGKKFYLVWLQLSIESDSERHY